MIFGSSVESIPFIPKKVVANPDADKRYPIPHTRIDMRYAGQDKP